MEVGNCKGAREFVNARFVRARGRRMTLETPTI